MQSYVDEKSVTIGAITLAAAATIEAVYGRAIKINEIRFLTSSTPPTAGTATITIGKRPYPNGPLTNLKTVSLPGAGTVAGDVFITDVRTLATDLNAGEVISVTSTAFTTGGANTNVVVCFYESPSLFPAAAGIASQAKAFDGGVGTLKTI